MQHFLMAAADEVTSRLASANASTFSRQHLANLIWAYATLEVFNLCNTNTTPADSTLYLQVRVSTSTAFLTRNRLHS